MRKLFIVGVLIILVLSISGCVSGVQIRESHTIDNITVTVSNVDYKDTGAITPAVDVVYVTVRNNQTQAITLLQNNFALYQSTWLDHIPFAQADIPTYPDFNSNNSAIIKSGESTEIILHMAHSNNNQKTFSFIPDGVFGHDSVSWDLNVYGD